MARFTPKSIKSGMRSATLSVAASDGTTLERSDSDDICDGTADEVEINEAITAL